MRAATFLTLLAFLCLTASPAGAEQGTVVSRLADKQIVEASGLAISAGIPDVAYTLNDSGNKPMVYAIRISTGQTVGRADLSRYKLEDTESLYVDPRGQMWVGDLGDNDHSRNDVSILRFPEPGLGKHKIVTAERFGVRYDDGKVDVEGMLVNPANGQVFLASRNRVGGAGTMYALPTTLQPGAPNVATNMKVQLPADVTDGTFSADGSLALLRTPSRVWVANPRGWTMVHQITLPRPEKSESITFERGDQTFLVGGEGEKSPLIRASLPLKPPAPAAEPTQDSEKTEEPTARSADFLPASEPANALGIPTAVIVAAGIALVSALVIAAAVMRRRR